MKLLRDARAVHGIVSAWSAAGARVALVPTMGNLHRGHLRLVEVARRRADRVVVSVFVNPTQFGPSEDFAAYPRTLAADRSSLLSAGADALFIPSVRVMYPRGLSGAATVSIPLLSRELCGAFRPGHFDGVCSVVLRLFNLVAPHIAVFGEKDYQQLTVLRQMAADLHLPVRLIGVPTVRERDGLAMSSRNQYLDPAERVHAPLLAATLREVIASVRGGRRDYARLERDAMRRLRNAGFRPDYVAVRRAGDLGAPERGERSLRVLAAAWLGRARLIDNLPLRLSR